MSTLQPPPPPSPTPTPPPLQTTSSTSKLLMFIRSELFPDEPVLISETPDVDANNSDAHQYAARRREKVITFMTIPKELEKLMGYGFFQCADAFLYVFTFLPLRCLYALWKYFSCLLGGESPWTCSLRASDKCELIKIVILLMSSWIFMYIDTNVIYHMIKSQSVIKLYIFFNMLEVGDRLFGCFSQDALDALFITATEQKTTESDTSSSSSSSPQHSFPSYDTDGHIHPPSSPHSKSKSIKKFSTLSHAIICGLSILGHALVILLQSTTLSVAINANNRALLTVMMSNNFVELKGSVFKKFDKMNLFQVSCSDIRERFHLFVLLLIVCLQTLREYSWEESRFWVLLPDCLMVLFAEIGVDWLKHCFITRFNELPLQVYNNYTRSLAYDMAESVKRKSKSFSCDYSDVVGRRLGFVPLPLAIVLIRVITPMFRVDNLLGLVILCALGYIGLASFRILNTIVLVGKAVRIIDEHRCCEQETGSSGASVSPQAKAKAGSSILKRSRTISGSDGDLLLAMKNEGKSDKKLTFVDAVIKDENAAVGVVGLQKIHLLANSNVSLTSVGFNEEMLKVEETIKKTEPLTITRVMGARKHSLGSNLDDERILGGGGGDFSDVIKQEVDEITQKQELELEEPEQDHQEPVFYCNDSVGDLLNTTVIENKVESESESHRNEDEDEVKQEQQQQPEVALSHSECVQEVMMPTKQEEEDSGNSNKEQSEEVQMKKKKFPWFK